MRGNDPSSLAAVSNDEMEDVMGEQGEENEDDKDKEEEKDEPKETDERKHAEEHGVAADEAESVEQQVP